MEVSMNGLRKRLIVNYNSLVRKLDKLSKENDYFPCYEIQTELDDLRSCIVTLAFTYMDGEGGWEAMDENTHFEQFNESDEK